MSGLLQTIRRNVFTILLLLLAGGFALLVLELAITGHNEGAQLIGIIASVLGVVLAVAALLTRGRAANWIAGALVVLSLSGLMGIYQHYLYGAGAAPSEVNENVPPLAPLSLAGLSLMTAVVVVGRPVARS